MSGTTQAGPISPADGPVAVTGSGGYIGSHIVLNLVNHGYDVRACVRVARKLSNTAHLTAMNRIGPGSVTLHECDMTIPGAYDETFAGCSGIFHAAAEMGNLEGSTPIKVYQGGLDATKLVMDSIKKAGTVKRLVYTSSFAAVVLADAYRRHARRLQPSPDVLEYRRCPRRRRDATPYRGVARQ